MKTNEIIEALKARFGAPAYAFLTEVPDGTGAQKFRTADALAMSLWPSRGLELFGFEVKASRTDWLKERDEPEKAERICQYCDRWYLVVGSKDIVKPGELPSTWGLMVPRGDSLVIEVEAPKLDPLPISRSFLASIARKVSEGTYCTHKELDLVKSAAYDSGYRAGLEREDTHSAQEQLKRVLAQVAEFEKTSGVSIGLGQWGETRDKIGDAVRRVLAADQTIEVSKAKMRVILGAARQIIDLSQDIT